MSIKAKLCQIEKLAGKLALSNIKRMDTEQLEETLMAGLEGEALRASTPEHAELIRKTAAYLMS